MAADVKKRKKRKKKTAVATDRRGQAPDTTAAREHAHRRRAPDTTAVDDFKLEQTNVNEDEQEAPVDRFRNAETMAPADELIPQGEYGATPRRKQRAVNHRATHTGLGTPPPKTSLADAVNAQGPTRAAASVIVPVLPVESSQADHDGHQQQPPIDSTIDRFSSRNVAVMAAADELRLIPAREHGVTPHQEQQAAVNHQPSSYQTDQAAASAIVPGPLVETSQSSMINELTAYIFTACLAFNMAKYQPIHPPPSMGVYM